MLLVNGAVIGGKAVDRQRYTIHAAQAEMSKTQRGTHTQLTLGQPGSACGRPLLCLHARQAAIEEPPQPPGPPPPSAAVGTLCPPSSTPRIGFRQAEQEESRENGGKKRGKTLIPAVGHGMRLPE